MSREMTKNLAFALIIRGVLFLVGLVLASMIAAVGPLAVIIT